MTEERKKCTHEVEAYGTYTIHIQYAHETYTGALSPYCRRRRCRRRNAKNQNYRQKFAKQIDE